MTSFLVAAVGLALLVAGGELLVRGALGLARRFGVSPLWIGLTIVAFGTSMPELVVSLVAGMRGQGAIALGNVIGSNIANVTLILGLAALVRPLHAQLPLVRREIPLLIVVSITIAVLLLDGRVGRVEGMCLLAGLGAWTWVGARGSSAAEVGDAGQGTSAAEGSGAVDAPQPGSLVPMPVVSLVGSLLRVGMGLVLLVIGAEAMVRGATALARSWGVSETVIGLSLVAVGTSLPELATSLAAARRGEADLAVGNVVGSNLFNVLGILGVSALVRPLADPGLRLTDTAVMAAAALVLLPIARTGRVVDRREGAGLLLSYAVYVGWRYTS